MAGTFRVVRGNRNAKLFYGGLLISNMGTWAQFTAIAIVVDRLTGRTTAIGILTALQFAPMLFLGAWAGALSDRLDRRRLATITACLLAVQASVVAILDGFGQLSLTAIYGLTAVMGIINAFENPARRGFVTELVPEDQVPSAVSFNTAVMTGSRIVGPALAAVLVGELDVATVWLFAVNAVSFTALIGSLLVLDPSTLHRAPRAARGGTPVRDGLRFVRRTPVLWVSFLAFAMIATFGFNYNVSLPRMASEIWGSEAWFGWVLTASSVGSVFGSLATASRAWVSVTWMSGMGMLLGASVVALGFAPNGWAAIALAPLMGFGGAGYVSGMNAITQQQCPPDMRGRILALTAVAFLGSYPIGGPITGVIGDVISLEWSLAYGGVISMLTVASVIWWALGRQPQPTRFEALRSLLGTATPWAPSTNERP